jgi:hypothetical protein
MPGGYQVNLTHSLNQDGTLFHSTSVPARQEILQHKDTSAHESIKDDSFDSFSQAAREDEEEASTIGGDWNNFRVSAYDCVSTFICS